MQIYDSLLTQYQIEEIYLSAFPDSHALPGDANDGVVVDAADASILAGHWRLQEGATWAMGDFNNDHRVDDADAAILAAHWTGPGEDAGPSVPEPGVLALLLSAAATLGIRRRR